MLIQCTKALLDKIGIKENELESSKGHEQFPESFFAWHANYLKINKSNAIVLMNNETRFPVVIYRPMKKNFTNLKGIIQEAITEALRMEGVRDDVIEAYFSSAGKISFSKTASRSMIARMTNAIHDIDFMQEYLDRDTKIQRYISMISGRAIQSSEKNKGFYPVDKVLECLGAIYGHNQNAATEGILDVNLYQLKIAINLEGHDVWRRVLVPSTYSFRHLHNIIQTVFDWHNSHLHEFVVKREGNESIKIVMDDDPEMIEFLDVDESDSRQERFVALEDIFPKHGEVIYEYDFGDDWEHIITLEKVVKSSTFQATYIDGNGERPPEDIGGLMGFEEYLLIMQNEQHPQYKHLKSWSENQTERVFETWKINQRLEHVIKGY